MKAKRFLFPVLMAIAVAFTACEEAEPEESCDGEDLGEMCSNDFAAMATFCSDGVNNSYYTYGGDAYECDGVEASTCDNALNDLAIQIIEDGCETSKSAQVTTHAKMTKMAEELLNQVKLESINY